MDCMDCHNRPAHNFDSPGTAVDNSMAQNRIDPKVPNIKKEAVEVLSRHYETSDDAMKTIATELSAKHPNDARISSVIDEVQKIYRENFFPLMKASWENYPVNIGHKEWPGCMRCHDGDHTTPDGAKSLATDCKTCHVILAQGADLEKLTPNVKFHHPGGAMGDQQCYECHNEKFADKLSAIKEGKTPPAEGETVSGASPAPASSASPGATPDSPSGAPASPGK
jgi:hypothetical protein